jgi:hypothetical protein
MDLMSFLFISKNGNRILIMHKNYIHKYSKVDRIKLDNFNLRNDKNYG